MSESTVMEKLGGWNVLHRKGQTDSVAVVMFHGYGANCHDLYPLAEEISSESHWYFPDAPMGEDGVQQWFSLRSLFHSGVIDLPTLLGNFPAGLEEVGSQAKKLCQALAMRHERIVLGGFSQGGMVAFEAYLQGFAPEKLLLMSTSLLDAERAKTRLAKVEACPALISHGYSDPVLPFAGAQRLQALLETKTSDVVFSPFEGGHGVHPSVVRDAASLVSGT